LVNAVNVDHEFFALILENDSGPRLQKSGIPHGVTVGEFLFINQSRRRLPASEQRFGGSGGILVAGGQVPESWRRLQWLRRALINSAYQAIDGTTLTASVCRFTVFC
jgi:hypothetical protein